MRMQIRHITPNNTIKFCMPITIRDKHSNAARVSVPLHQLEACLQMLQPFEAHTLTSDDCTILIRSDRLNQFTLDIVESKHTDIPCVCRVETSRKCHGFANVYEVLHSTKLRV